MPYTPESSPTTLAAAEAVPEYRARVKRVVAMAKNICGADLDLTRPLTAHGVSMALKAGGRGDVSDRAGIKNELFSLNLITA